MNEHGLTKENLVATLPVALQKDESAVALAEAIAELLSKRPAEIERLRIYPAIDQLDEQLLDILAYDFKVDWWDPEYTLEEKRQTLKDSWRVHKTLGTKAAVLTAISAIYPHTQVIEWFEYGGEPYHFKLNINITNDSIDSAKLRRVLNRLNFYKSLRSHNDGIHYFMEPEKQPVALVWTGCPGLRGTMEMEVPVPVQPTPGGEAKINAIAGTIGENVQMPAEIDMSATVPHGEAVAPAGARIFGARTVTAATLDMSASAPTGRGCVQTGIMVEGLQVCLTSDIDMRRDTPHQTAAARAAFGSYGCHMKMVAIVAAPEPDYPGGAPAARTAVMSTGIYQKFVTEVPKNDPLE